MEAVVVLMRELVSSERLEDAPTGWQERLTHNTTAVHQLLARDEYSSVRERLSSVWKAENSYPRVPHPMLILSGPTYWKVCLSCCA